MGFWAIVGVKWNFSQGLGLVPFFELSRGVDLASQVMGGGVKPPYPLWALWVVLLSQQYTVHFGPQSRNLLSTTLQ